MMISDTSSRLFLRSLFHRLAPAALLSFVLLLSSCAALPIVRGYYTPGEAYRDAAAVVGYTVAIRGQVDIVAALCTEIACPEDNPCCNLCNYSLGFKIDDYHNIYFSGEAAGCGGDVCHAECLIIKEGRPYEITGRFWQDLGDLYDLELKAWKPIESTRR